MTDDFRPFHPRIGDRVSRDEPLVRRLGAASRERCCDVDEERLERIALILSAIDLTIADVEARADSDVDEQLRILRGVRERWREKMEQEGSR